MAEGRERNRILTGAVALLILALAVYGPVALLAPLPTTRAVALPGAGTTSVSTPPVLPAAGSSGVTIAADQESIAGGSETPVPMAAAAKIVTALVVLDAHPLGAGRSGPAIPVTTEDYASYVRYSAEGTRAIRVVAGDTWSERETLDAMLIASSNNHAEMLARWAFGTLDGYLTAADKWLAKNHLDSIQVTDTTGLSPDSMGTGADLARLAALAMADPFLSDAVALDSSSTIRGVQFENTIRYRPEDSVVGISRSYTDEAGVCLLFAVPVAVDGGDPVTVYGAFLGEPSYDDLAADMDSFLDGLPAAVERYELIPAGTAVARYTTPWGTKADAVTIDAIPAVGWGDAAAPTTKVDTDELDTARSGAIVGTVTVTAGGTGASALKLSAAIRDPGPLWRLGNPGVVVPAFVRWAGSGGER